MSMQQDFRNNSHNKYGTIAVTELASCIVCAEESRRAEAGLPGASKKAVASEYIIAHAAALGRGEKV